MGYDYIIRVSVDTTKEITKESLLEAYKNFIHDTTSEFYFGCDDHGGSNTLACGGIKDYIKKLMIFTKHFKNTTFTFYNHYFDYESLEILVIKNKIRLLYHV